VTNYAKICINMTLRHGSGEWLIKLIGLDWVNGLNFLQRRNTCVSRC